MNKLLITLLFLLANSAFATCLKPELTPAKDVRIEGDTVMIVTHASAAFDPRYASKYGVDLAVKFAKSKNISVIYLVSDDPMEGYFMADCNPTYWVYSSGGEMEFNVTASNLYIVGGHLELCMSRTMNDVIFNWSKQAPRDLHVTYVNDAIYSNGKLIYEEDVYFNDLRKFLGVVTYTRPGGEQWPKLTLNETMGIIKNRADHAEYITRVLPRWDRTFPESMRVEVQMDDYVQVLRKGNGTHKIRFDFVETAM